MARLADYWAEVLGGPPRYSQVSDGQSGMLSLHAGMQADDDLGTRFASCFAKAIDDARLPDDAEFRRALLAYMAWATEDVRTYNTRDSSVPLNLPVPHWGWDGLEDGRGG